MSPRIPDPEIGQRFGRWTVLELPADDKHRSVRVRCDCGNESRPSYRDVYNSRSSQCRTCANRINGSAGGHGESKSRLYAAWIGMRRRCSDVPGGCYYDGWAGRGISVEPVWETSYENFRDWSLANGWRANAGLSLDRIDNDGNYGPENCRWTDMRTQSRNRRTNRLLTAFGETKAVVEWAEDPRIVISYTILRSRLKQGWEDERVLFEPLRKYVRRAA